MRGRARILVFILIAIGAILILEAGLSGLNIQPGNLLLLPWQKVQRPEGGASIPGGELVYNIFRAVYFICLLSFPIALIYVMLTPEGRKRLLKELLRIIPFVLIFTLLARAIQRLAGGVLVGGEATSMNGIVPPDAGYPGPEADFVPSAPNWAVWGISIGLAVLIVLVIAFVAWLIYRKRKKELPHQRLVEEAQNALDALEAGGDLKNVVIRCYFEMSKIVQTEGGLQRGYEVTPHEFQTRLLEKGLPREPVSQLTRLFEEVRYGTKTPGKLEEQRASSSLTAIIQFFKGKS